MKATSKNTPTYLLLLELEWKRLFRNSVTTGSALAGIALGIMLLYFGGLAVALGFLLPGMLEEAFPSEPGWRVFGGYLVYYFLVDLALRLLVQGFPVLNVARMLVLPIQRGSLTHFLIFRSWLSIFNWFPWLFFLPFAFGALFPVAPWHASLAWIGTLAALIGFNNLLAFLVKRFVAGRYDFGWAFAALPILPILLAQLGLFDLPLLFSPVVNSGFWSLGLAMAGLGGLYLMLYRTMARRFYLDTELRSGMSMAFDLGLNFLQRWGQVGALIKLQLQIILRNKRPRQTIFFQLIFLIYPIYIFTKMDGSGTMLMFWALILPGFGAIGYGQFMLAWESSFFSLLLGSPFSWKAYVEAQYRLTVFLILFYSAIMSVYVFFYPFWGPYLLAGTLFNLGVNGYFPLVLARYNTKPIDANKSSFFNNEGVSVKNFFVMVPLFGALFVLFFPVQLIWGAGPALFAIGGLGLMGILLKPIILPRIASNLAAHRHTLSESYKKNARS